MANYAKSGTSMTTISTVPTHVAAPSMFYAPPHVYILLNNHSLLVVQPTIPPVGQLVPLGIPAAPNNLPPINSQPQSNFSQYNKILQ